MRGLMAEFGIFLAQKVTGLRQSIGAHLEDLPETVMSRFDPSFFVLYHEHNIVRQVNRGYSTASTSELTGWRGFIAPVRVE